MVKRLNNITPYRLGRGILIAKNAVGTFWMKTDISHR